MRQRCLRCALAWTSLPGQAAVRKLEKFFVKSGQLEKTRFVMPGLSVVLWEKTVRANTVTQQEYASSTKGQENLLWRQLRLS